jgi:hypothetical protein
MDGGWSTKQETGGQGVVSSDSKPADAAATGGGTQVRELAPLDDDPKGAPPSGIRENAGGKLQARKPSALPPALRAFPAAPPAPSQSGTR